MRRSLTALFIALLLVVGFGIGLLVGLVVRDGGVALTPGQTTTAAQVANLQERVIRALQSDYYRRVDVTRLGTKAIDGMLKSLNDPWTVYLDPKETKLLEEQTTAEYSGIGAYLEKAKDGSLLVTGVFKGSPAQKAGMAAGDHIVSVDGVPAKGHGVDANVAMIKGPEGTEVRLLVRKKGGDVQHLTLTRQQIDVPIVHRRMLTTSNGVKVGYVELSEFAVDAGADVRSAVDWTERHGARWIVFDLRYNPGGLVNEAISVSSLFIRNGTVVSTEGLHSPKEVYPVSGKVATTLPMVLLVNRYSASASEITAGALQDHERATLIGTRTFGKGLVQEILPMPQKAALKLTIAVYYTPDGRDINKRGIRPEVIVQDKPKQKGDEQLKAALTYIAGHSQP
jgi:carboxyl-terminal processing protease